LLARRLVERGVSFVEVTLDGWDTHTNNFEQVKTLSQTLDPAFGTLLADLKDRGMLGNTLVVWMGEFGRTPLINPRAAVITSRWRGPRSSPGQRQGRPGNRQQREGRRLGCGAAGRSRGLPRTVFSAVGVNPATENFTEGRPIRLVKDGKPIKELVG